MSPQADSLTVAPSDAGLAFDSLAPTYDQVFTETSIGREQRHAVWRVLAQHFKGGDHILELNCGTGVDAVFLAKQGVRVLACDASSEMIHMADLRKAGHHNILPISFRHLPTERMRDLQAVSSFDGAFSNFSGINCIADLPSTAASLSKLLQPRARLILCCSTKYCLVETAYYLCRGRPRKAIRRWSGQSLAKLSEKEFTVYYHSLWTFRRKFAPHFRLVGYQGIGVAIPPSYLNAWMEKHPSLFRTLCRMEAILARLPILRVTGDHMLLCFEKVSQ